MRRYYAIFILFVLSCRPHGDVSVTPAWPTADDTINFAALRDSSLPDRMVAFAKTLIGTPYKFGCTAPSTGFDCSGFIGYVFNHFGMNVPRSSVDFTNQGVTIPLSNAKPGDLILFTGTNSRIRTVGHIGMVITHDTTGIQFIHASSGAEEAVTTTWLEGGYVERFVKIVRMTN